MFLPQNNQRLILKKFIMRSMNNKKHFTCVICGHGLRNQRLSGLSPWPGLVWWGGEIENSVLNKREMEK